MKNWRQADGGTQADIEHHIHKYNSRSLEYLQFTVREFFAVDVSLEIVRDIRSRSLARDARDDRQDNSLGLYESFM